MMNSTTLSIAFFEVYEPFFNWFFKPMINVAGTFGNILAICVLRTTPELKHFASSHYLVALAISDLIFLFTLIFTWFDSITLSGVSEDSTGGCKLFTFLAQASDAASVWFVVAISYDRFTALVYPYEYYRATLCTQRHQSYLLTVITVAAVLISCWSIIGATPVIFSESLNDSVVYVCGSWLDETLYETLNIADAILSCFIPSLIVFGLNLAAAHQLRKRREFHRFLTSPTQVSTALRREGVVNTSRDQLSVVLERNETPTLEDELRPLSRTKFWRSYIHFPSTPDAPSMSPCPSEDRERSELQIACALLVVTSVYIVLIVPSYVLRLIGTHASFWSVSTKYFHTFKALELISYSMYYAHHSLNFYFYTFMCSRMRQALSSFVSGRWRMRGVNGP